MSFKDEYFFFAAFYDLFLNPVLDHMREKVGQIMVDEGLDSLLDLCCGTGRQCILLQRKGIKSAGVDISPSMLDQAVRKSPGEIVYRLEDASKTSFSDSCFDAVLLSLALHEKNFKKQMSIVKEAMRIVKPEGGLILLDYIKPKTWLSKTIQPVIKLVEHVAGSEHFHCYSQFMYHGALDNYELDSFGWSRVRFYPFCFGSLGLAVYKKLR